MCIVLQCCAAGKHATSDCGEPTRRADAGLSVSKYLSGASRPFSGL